MSSLIIIWKARL